MNKEQWHKSKMLLFDVVKKAGSIRQLARDIHEDIGDISRWRSGRTKIRPLAVIKIFRAYGIEPQLLRPDVFEDDVVITFKKGK